MLGRLRGAEADATKQMLAGKVMGGLDDDLDGKIQLSETKGRVYKALAPKFAEFDVNKDGGIDATELKAAMPTLMALTSRGGRSRSE